MNKKTISTVTSDYDLAWSILKSYNNDSIHKINAIENDDKSKIVSENSSIDKPNNNQVNEFVHRKLLNKTNKLLYIYLNDLYNELTNKSNQITIELLHDLLISFNIKPRHELIERYINRSSRSTGKPAISISIDFNEFYLITNEEISKSLIGNKIVNQSIKSIDVDLIYLNHQLRSFPAIVSSSSINSNDLNMTIKELKHLLVDTESKNKLSIEEYNDSMKSLDIDNKVDNKFDKRLISKLDKKIVQKIDNKLDSKISVSNITSKLAELI